MYSSFNRGMGKARRYVASRLAPLDLERIRGQTRQKDRI